MSIHPADRATSRPTQHRSNINFSCFFSARHHRKLNIFGSKQYEGVTFGVQITWGEDCSLVSYMKSIKRFTHTHTQMHTFNDRATCLSHGGVLQNCSVLSGTKAAVPGHRTGKSTSTRAQWHGENLDKLQPDGGRTWKEKKGFIYNNNKKSAEKKSDYSNRGSDYKKQAEAAVEDGWTDLAEIKGTQTMRGTERKKETEVSSWQNKRIKSERRAAISPSQDGPHKHAKAQHAGRRATAGRLRSEAAD